METQTNWVVELLPGQRCRATAVDTVGARVNERKPVEGSWAAVRAWIREHQQTHPCRRSRAGVRVGLARAVSAIPPSCRGFGHFFD